jgi:succinyl-CoA synthetase beta subunit
MAQKNIYEYDAKKLLASELSKYYPEFKYHDKLVVVECDTDLEQLIKDNPWIDSEKVVVKPDQLFGKRGKANLFLFLMKTNTIYLLPLREKMMLFTSVLKGVYLLKKIGTK